MSVTMYLKIHILSKRWTFSPEGGEGVGSARTLELKRGVIRWWTNIRLWPIFRRTGIDRLTCVGNGPHHSTESGGIFFLVSVRCQVSEKNSPGSHHCPVGGRGRAVLGHKPPTSAWQTDGRAVSALHQHVCTGTCRPLSHTSSAVLAAMSGVYSSIGKPRSTGCSACMATTDSRGSPVNSHQRDHKQAHPKLSIHRMHGMHGRHTCLP
jgi:hypothetical protein